MNTAYDYKGQQFWVGKREDGFYFSTGINFGMYEDGFFDTEAQAAAAAREFIRDHVTA